MRTRTTQAAVLALALTLVTAGCGGSDGGDDVEADGTTTTSSAGDGVTTTTSGGAGGSGPTTPGGPAATAAAGTATTARPAGGSAGSGSAAGTGGGKATAAGAYKPTQPGTYTYATTGKRSSPAFGEQPVDSQDALKVESATGQDQKTTQTSDDGTTEQVLRFGADGIRLVSMRIANRAATKDFKPASPVMVLPHPLADGQSWAWKMSSTDGATTVDAKFSFVRRENLSIGGESVATNVIEATVTTGGDITSTSRQTIWMSPVHRLIVQEKDVTDGSFGQVQFHSETLRKLRSTKPS